MLVYLRSDTPRQPSPASSRSRKELRCTQRQSRRLDVRDWLTADRSENKQSRTLLTWTIDVCWHARQTSPLGGSLMVKSVRANPCRWPRAPCIQHQAAHNTPLHARTHVSTVHVTTTTTPTRHRLFLLHVDSSRSVVNYHRRCWSRADGRAGAAAENRLFPRSLPGSILICSR